MQFELLLVGRLQIAYYMYDQQRQESWETFRVRVLKRTA